MGVMKWDVSGINNNVIPSINQCSSSLHSAYHILDSIVIPDDFDYAYSINIVKTRVGEIRKDVNNTRAWATAKADKLAEVENGNTILINEDLSPQIEDALKEFARNCRINLEGRKKGEPLTEADVLRIKKALYYADKKTLEELAERCGIDLIKHTEKETSTTHNGGILIPELQGELFRENYDQIKYNYIIKGSCGPSALTVLASYFLGKVYRLPELDEDFDLDKYRSRIGYGKVKDSKEVLDKLNLECTGSFGYEEALNGGRLKEELDKGNAVIWLVDTMPFSTPDTGHFLAILPEGKGNNINVLDTVAFHYDDETTYTKKGGITFTLKDLLANGFTEEDIEFFRNNNNATTFWVYSQKEPITTTEPITNKIDTEKDRATLIDEIFNNMIETPENNSAKGGITQELLNDLIKAQDNKNQVLNASNDEMFKNIVNYDQNNYNSVRFGAGTVAGSGCGITSIAGTLTYLCDRLITPKDLAERYNDETGGKGGTPYELFEKIAEDYGVSVERCDNQGWNDGKIEQALKNKQPIIVYLPGKTMFATKGHYVTLTGITEDGRILINDPNGNNYEIVGALKDGFENGFPIETFTNISNSTYFIYNEKENKNKNYFNENEYTNSADGKPDEEVDEILDGTDNSGGNTKGTLDGVKDASKDLGTDETTEQAQEENQETNNSGGNTKGTLDGVKDTTKDFEHKRTPDNVLDITPPEEIPEEIPNKEPNKPTYKPKPPTKPDEVYIQPPDISRTPEAVIDAVQNIQDATSSSDYISKILKESGYITEEEMNKYSNYSISEILTEFDKFGWEEITDVTKLQTGDIIIINNGNEDMVRIYAGNNSWYSLESTQVQQGTQNWGAEINWTAYRPHNK